jgi:spore maturation protein CgeB
VLLFHDTHHRLVTDPAAMDAYDLSAYDGVLAFGEVLKNLYLSRRLTRHAWTWHEAADTRRFHPIPGVRPTKDLVWVGNWGDDERSAEIHEFLIDPVRELGLSATVHGVRYPEAARTELQRAGIDYRGWLTNHRVPQVFASHRVTVHIPRRAYVEALPGIPTIRPFEALACGIPLISAPWNDEEHLFTPGEDYLVARDGNEMKTLLRSLLVDEAKRESLSQHGLATINGRHSCALRVDELLSLVRRLRPVSSGRKIQPVTALET